MVATMATSQNPKKKALVRAAYKLTRFEQFEKSGSVLVNSMLTSALYTSQEGQLTPHVKSKKLCNAPKKGVLFLRDSYLSKLHWDS
jgi:hypothetical protein